MQNLVALGLMVSDKNIFKDLKKNSVLLLWQPEFLKESNYFKKSEEAHGRNISVKFHQNPISSFREEVNEWTDGRRNHDGQQTMT